VNKLIQEYLTSYLFKRFDLNSNVVFDYNTRTISLGKVKIEIPDISRKEKPFTCDILGIDVPYCRYNENIDIKISSTTITLNYDLLGEMYDHLTLVYEKEDIISYKSESIFYPVLDMKIYNFFLQIKDFTDIKYRLFDSKQFLVGVSHDIDRTGDSYKYRVITHFFQAIKQKKPLLFFKGIFGKNEENNIDTILEKEKEFNAKSTWFILTRYGLKKNADYHLQDKEFVKALKLIKEKKFELGIHIPFMDLEIGEIIKEFEKLGKPDDLGMRMHHLRGDYKELMVLLNKAKVKYDSTFGLNECIAYRFGTSVPFHPIIDDEILENIYEIPMNIMDLQITDSISYKNQLKKLFSILQATGGVCILNWHNNRFNKTKYGNIWVDTFNISLEETVKSNGSLTNLSSILNYFT
jgi:hypothetical protein